MRTNYGSSHTDYDINREKRERCECHTEHKWGADVIDIPIAMEVEIDETPRLLNKISAQDIVIYFSCITEILGQIIGIKKH